MTCNVVKKWMYGYRELTDDEQQKFHEHINSCESCMRQWTAYQEEVDMIQHVMSPAVQMQDALTDRIMNEIIQHKRLSGVRHSTSFLHRWWLRGGMVTASLLLLMGFFYEFNNAGAVKHQEVGPTNYSRVIKLNSSQFYNPALRDSLPQFTSLLSVAECVKACGSHDRWGSCETCKTKTKRN